MSNSNLVNIQMCEYVTLFNKTKKFKFEQRALQLFLTPGFQVGTRNGEKGLNVVTPTQSFENYRLDSAMIEEGMY